MQLGKLGALALGLVTTAAGGALVAQEASGAPLWLVACSNQMQPDTLLCESSQSIVVTDEAGRSQRLATAAFLRAAGSDETTAVVTLPLELDLTIAPRLAVDGNDLGELAWQACDAQGCHASANADESWLDALQTGDALVIHATARGGQEFDFTFQLQDFAAAEAVLP